ncbi:unnamed protein product, partial [Amoebophrya sp. A120]|eukprot:GSA120T00013346001.1
MASGRLGAGRPYGGEKRMPGAPGPPPVACFARFGAMLWWGRAFVGAPGTIAVRSAPWRVDGHAKAEPPEPAWRQFGRAAPLPPRLRGRLMAPQPSARRPSLLLPWFVRPSGAPALQVCP